MDVDSIMIIIMHADAERVRKRVLDAHNAHCVLLAQPCTGLGAPPSSVHAWHRCLAGWSLGWWWVKWAVSAGIVCFGVHMDVFTIVETSCASPDNE